MAKRMALVPTEWIQNYNELLSKGPQQRQQGGSEQQQPQQEQGQQQQREYFSPESPITYEPKPQQDLMSLAEFLPKGYRSRARMLLHYLEGKVKLNAQQRVIYETGKVGSHILDLVKYFVANIETHRPLDAPKFQKIIAQAGVPSSALPKKRRLEPKGLGF